MACNFTLRDALWEKTGADAALIAKYNNGEITKEKCDRALSHKY